MINLYCIGVRREFYNTLFDVEVVEEGFRGVELEEGFHFVYEGVGRRGKNQVRFSGFVDFSDLGNVYIVV